MIRWKKNGEQSLLNSHLASTTRRLCIPNSQERKGASFARMKLQLAQLAYKCSPTSLCIFRYYIFSLDTVQKLPSMGSITIPMLLVKSEVAGLLVNGQFSFSLVKAVNLVTDGPC